MNYHNITYPDMNNGDGLRVVLWLSGCDHHCKGCQNPQTWNPDSGIKFDEKAFNELFDELSKDYISGLTLSGGDPLHKDNVNEVLHLLHKIRILFPTKTIWLYTGYTWEEILKTYYTIGDINYIRYSILYQCDVLVDGEYKEELRDITLPWIGSSNQRVIDVQKSLKFNKIILHDS